MKLPHDALGYVSAARGFKSGGCNPLSTSGRGYAPEWVWNYEGGWKGAVEFSERRTVSTQFSAALLLVSLMYVGVGRQPFVRCAAAGRAIVTC
jgi:hypothetical protein